MSHISYSPRNKDGEGWLENHSGVLRTSYCDEIRPGIRHTGWFCGEFQDCTLRGVVVRLSHGRCYPAYEESGNGGLLVDWSDCRDDARECALAADSFAKHAAGKEREYNEAWRAGARFADLGEEVKEIRTRIISICAELRAARLIPGTSGLMRLCETVRESVRDSLDEIGRLRAKRDELRQFSRWRADAFGEGSGLTA